MSEIHIYNSRLCKRIDSLFAVLVASDETQFFPEFTEIFGKDSLVKFLDIFAGQTIVVPPREIVEAKIRDVTFWMELEKDPESVTRLAAEYEMAEHEVRERADAIRVRLKSMGIEVRNG